jgi:hypothetical protein
VTREDRQRLDKAVDDLRFLVRATRIAGVGTCVVVAIAVVGAAFAEGWHTAGAITAIATTVVLAFLIATAIAWGKNRALRAAVAISVAVTIVSGLYVLTAVSPL